VRKKLENDDDEKEEEEQAITVWSLHKEVTSATHHQLWSAVLLTISSLVWTAAPINHTIIIIIIIIIIESPSVYLFQYRSNRRRRICSCWK
jgi:hypothetical protein